MAKLVKCKTCGEEIASSAKVCPHCGAKQKKFLLIPVILVVLVIGIIGAASSGGEKDSDVSSSRSVSSQQETQVEQDTREEAPPTDDEEYFRDGVFQTKDFRIEITDWRVIPAGEVGNRYGDGSIIAFWYTVTNRKTEDTIDPSSSWILYMSAVQDNDPNMVNKLDVSAHPDSTLVDNQLAQIKPGGTLSNAIGYELSDTTTPVTLTASLFGLKEYGTMTFNIAE